MIIIPADASTVSLVLSKLVFSDFKETAVKSSNGSAEMRAQRGKSNGRGAAESSDTHLNSEWIQTGVAQAKRRAPQT